MLSRSSRSKAARYVLLPLLALLLPVTAALVGLFSLSAASPPERQLSPTQVVNWDQRGAGKSYAAGLDPDTLTVEQSSRTPCS